MATEIWGGLDLFGNPLRPGRGQRGRPPYDATEKDRNKIKLLLALGWANTRIANAVDLSLATLKRYFRAELAVRDEMRDRLLGWQFEKAVELAEAGNVAALKEVGKILERNDMMGATSRLDKAQKKGKPKAETLGKKAMADEEAKAAGQESGWGGDLTFPGLTN